MKIEVSEGVFKRVEKMLREGKTAPLLKFYINKRLERGDVVILRGGTYSARVKIEDIREYVVDTTDISSIPDELRIVYDDDKLIHMIGKNRVSKIFIIFVKSADS